MKKSRKMLLIATVLGTFLVAAISSYSAVYQCKRVHTLYDTNRTAETTPCYCNESPAGYSNTCMVDPQGGVCRVHFCDAVACCHEINP